MNIGIIGSGQVAKALGAGFMKHGHDVMLGTRDPSVLLKQRELSSRFASSGAFPVFCGTNGRTHSKWCTHS